MLLKKCSLPGLHKYVITGMPPYTYFTHPFNGICQLFLMSLVYEMESKENIKTDSCEELHLQWASANTLKGKLHDRMEAFVALACNGPGKGRAKPDRWIVTGSKKIFREEIFEPLKSHSLGLNDRWKISTAATQIQREDRQLRMDQFDARLPMGTRRGGEKRGMRTGFGSTLILF